MGAPVFPHAHRGVAPGLGLDGEGLTDEHFFEVARLARALPGRWFVERREDEFGVVAALLVQDGEGADGLSFALSRHAREVHVDLRRGAHFEPLGTFRTVGRAMERVMDHLEAATPGAGRGGLTRDRESREAGVATHAAGCLGVC